MLTLKLLGSPAIERDGVLVAGRATQGHRLAMLTVLALAHGRPVRRDRLVALLWPDSTTDRARHHLSDALYIARTAFGADAIRATGDELRLGARELEHDVGIFERLLEARRLEEAVEAYSGPLLDGFHLSGSTGFAHWLDVERARLAQRYAGALESLADSSEARGDLAPAASWWRRLAMVDPYNGRVALRLMRALEAAGDRAGALRHARIHTALLREEFEAEPDPDVLALAERLRVEPMVRRVLAPVISPVTGSRQAPTPAAPSGAITPGATTSRARTTGARSSGMIAITPPGRRGGTARRSGSARDHAMVVIAALLAWLVLVWGGDVPRARETPSSLARSIAVLTFSDLSPDSTDRHIGIGLTEQIIAALGRIGGLHVDTRDSSFAHNDDERDVRAIGRSLGVEAVLEGSVRRAGDQLRVTARLLDIETGLHVWSGEYDRDATDLLAVQDEIARAIARALEQRLPPRARSAGS